MARKLTDLQERFLDQLTSFLVDNQAGKSIRLEMEQSAPGNYLMLAREWAALRSATPLFGYPTPAEARKILARFLFDNPPEPKKGRKLHARRN
jgi:hypothetical protein